MESLRQLRNLHHKSQQEVADYIGISRPMYSFYEAGKNNPSAETIAKLAEYYGVPIEVITGKVDFSKVLVTASYEPVETKTVKIPIVGHIRAGYDGVTDNNVEGYMYIEESVVNKFPNCFSINVYGDSMEPEIHNGDRVIVQPCSTVNSGDVAIVCLNGDEATIKRVRFDDNGFTVVPTNPKYKPMTYTREEVDSLPITICGRVIQVRHDYF